MKHRYVDISGAMLVRFLAAVFGAMLVVVTFSPAASAHSAAGSPSSNYVTTIESVLPESKNFTVRVVEQGSRLEVRWITGGALIVEGYDGEPYLRIGPGGVEENRQSTATYANKSRNGTETIPSNLQPDGPPEWKRISVAPTARFHDHRIHYMGSVAPPAVEQDATKRQLVQTFDIIIRTENRSASSVVSGRVEWIPGPSPTKALLFAGGIAATIAACALWAGVQPGRRRIAQQTMIGLTLMLVAVDVFHLVGISGGVLGGSVLVRMLSVGYASMAAWIMAVISVVLLLRKRDDAMYLLTFTAGLMTLVGGVADLSTLSRSSIVFLWSSPTARLLVTLTIGLGVGLVVAGVLLTRPTTERLAAIG